MAAFKTLKNVSIDFDVELQQLASNLFSAGVRETSDDIITKKLRDLSFLSSKYLLVHATETSLSPKIEQRVQNGADVLTEYEAAVHRRIIDGAFVKSVSHSRAVQTLLTTRDEQLDPELLARKRKILFHHHLLRSLDIELRQLDAVVLEKQKAEDHLRAQWDLVLGDLRDKTARATAGSEINTTGPHYNKLRTLVSKMEFMRFLMNRLVTGPTGYDWLEDADKRINTLILARESTTVEDFVLSDI